MSYIIVVAILWWLVGVASALGVIKAVCARVELGDVAPSMLVGLFGPVLLWMLIRELVIANRTRG